MNYKFSLTIRSDIDYEELLSDISRSYCPDKKCRIATISRENGVDNMEIEVFFNPKGRHYFNFSFDVFLEMIERAKKELDYPANVPLSDEEVAYRKLLINYGQTFSVDIGEAYGYKKKAARFFYEGQLLMIISQDQGLEDIQIEVCFSDRSKTSYIFRLDDFVQALLSAKQQLIETSYS